MGGCPPDPKSRVRHYRTRILKTTAKEFEDKYTVQDRMEAERQAIQKGIPVVLLTCQNCNAYGAKFREVGLGWARYCDKCASELG